MDTVQALIGIYRSDDPPGAVEALARGLGPVLPVRCAAWVERDGTEPLCAHPPGTELPTELVAIASHIARPEIFPLDSLSPVGAARFPGSEMLVLPLSLGDAPQGAVVLIAPVRSFGERSLDAEWSPIREALQSVGLRHGELTRTRRECEELRRRTREMEALDVLGLAVNRTLDAREVLTLVVRFSRTLLGAHYAIVYTRENRVVQAVATIGIGSGIREADEDPFAERVMRAGKPVVLGAGGEPFDPDDFPLHARCGMKVGLGIPLSLFGETFGALVVGYHDDYPVTSRDTLLALTIGRHAAIAINNSQLHSAIAERSTELAAAYQELRELTMTKERFFTSISHELRTPLNGILGYQALILEGVAGELPEIARDYVEKANRSARGLLRLVNEILDYGKIEAGKLELIGRAVTVAELIDDALLTVAPLVDQKALALTSAFSRSSRPIHTDADRVRQILVNLLSNAIKFTPEGKSLSLEVRDEREGDEGVVEVRVRDSGPGIPPEDRDRIFQEFEQVAGTAGGTGLGLPISKKLAKLLGGDLWLESTMGEGSTFVLRLPSRLAPPGVTRGAA